MGVIVSSKMGPGRNALLISRLVTIWLRESRVKFLRFYLLFGREEFSTRQNWLVFVRRDSPDHSQGRGMHIGLPHVPVVHAVVFKIGSAQGNLTVRLLGVTLVF